MLEQKLIEHGSPTLVKLKSANMFTYAFEDRQALDGEIADQNRRLNEKGVYLELLRIQGDRALLLLYRRSALEHDLSQEGVREILRFYGYVPGSLEDDLKHLKERLSVREEFPHEIGLFLGYPLEDVRCFIQQEGHNYLCSGCWKVYGNVCAAKKLFEQFHLCKLDNLQLFRSGRTLMQLTVGA